MYSILLSFSLWGTAVGHSIRYDKMTNDDSDSYMMSYMFWAGSANITAPRGCHQPVVYCFYELPHQVSINQLSGPALVIIMMVMMARLVIKTEGFIDIVMIGVGL